MPTVFVAFGVTGDLMRQKILHDLFSLHSRGGLPEHFDIIGVSRKDWSDDKLRDYVRDVLAEKQKEFTMLDSFLERLTFTQGDVSEPLVFQKLNEKIAGREALLYVALSPQLYKEAFLQLTSSSLATNTANLRIMIEKPFGTSGKEAEELNTILYSVFSEAQIYRVDHYGAKESLANLPAIDAEKLKEIRITFLQKEDVAKRGAFFEATGALRDLGQNHMMMMLAAVAPAESRAAVVSELHTLSPDEIATHTKRAQYVEYHKVPDVAPNSKVETYFKIETTWRDIPTTFEAGKYMTEDRKEISLTYTDGEMQNFPIENNHGASEHEVLIGDCMRGQHERFMSSEEIAAQWRFVDPIEEQWREGNPALTLYPPFA